MFTLFPPPKLPPPLTPCIGICAMAADGLCEGCARTLAEIAGWGALSNEERRKLMDEVLPAREANRG